MKRTSLAVCLLVLWASTAETRQDFVDNADASQDDEDSPTARSANHPYGKHTSLCDAHVKQILTPKDTQWAYLLVFGK